MTSWGGDTWLGAAADYWWYWETAPSCFLLTGSQALMNGDKQYEDYLLAWKSEERKGSNNPQDSTALRSLLVRWDFKTLDSGHSESFWRSWDYSGILRDRLNSIELMSHSCSRFCKQYWIPPPPNLSVCWSEERFPGSAANSREGREGSPSGEGGVSTLYQVNNTPRHNQHISAQ